MKKLLSLVVVLLFCACTNVSAKNPNEGFGLDIGYMAVNLDSSFSHQTHQDDSFMGGDAGSTDIGLAHYFALGGSYRVPIANKTAINLGLGGLVGLTRDEHQNDNDSRPADNGSFVYSSSPWGVYGILGVEYAFADDWYAGIEGQIVGAYVDHGWDRWGSDESASSEFLWVPTIGPKLGYMIADGYAIEATVQAGSGGAGCRIGVVFTF